MEIGFWFICIFTLTWLLGPVTQVLFLAAPRFHHKIGMTEDKALKPEFKWFLLDEKAIAIADMTHLFAGCAFIWLALIGNKWALLFGLYSCSCYVYIALLAISRWRLFGQNQISPISAAQLPFYMAYMGVFLAFGMYGLVYMWDFVQP